jgi:polyisoprenoid-binding protein YceI
MKKVIILMVITILISINRIYSQEIYNVDTKSSEILVSGTSTFHDWEMKSKAVMGKMKASVEKLGIKIISDVLISCNSKSLLSDEKGMNDNAYEALKADTYPVIKFVSASILGLKSNNCYFSGTITGSLTIAGKTNKVAIPFTGSVSALGNLIVKGSFGFNMTQYDIERPSFMMGMMTTGDYIVLNFNLNFTKSNT